MDIYLLKCIITLFYFRMKTKAKNSACKFVNCTKEFSKEYFYMWRRSCVRYLVRKTNMWGDSSVGKSWVKDQKYIASLLGACHEFRLTRVSWEKLLFLFRRTSGRGASKVGGSDLCFNEHCDQKMHSNYLSHSWYDKIYCHFDD